MQQFTVTGMHCAACSASVEKAVKKVPGVTSCAVSLLTNSMGVEGTAEPAAVIKAVYLRFFSMGQLLDEGEVFVLIHRAVHIVCRPLVVARGEERGIHVHALKRHDWGNGIIEMQVAVRTKGGYLLGDSVA